MPYDPDDHYLPAPPGGIYVGPNPNRSAVNLEQNDIPLDPLDYGDINAAAASGQDLTDEQKQRLMAKQQPKYRVVGGHLTPDQIAKLSGIYSKGYTGPKQKKSIKYSIGDGPMQEYTPDSNPNAPEKTITYAQAMADLRGADDAEATARYQKQQDEDRAFKQRVALLPIELADKRHSYEVADREAQYAHDKPREDAQIAAANAALAAQQAATKHQGAMWKREDDEYNANADLRQAERDARMNAAKSQFTPEQARQEKMANNMLAATAGRTDPQAGRIRTQASQILANLYKMDPSAILGQYSPPPADAQKAAMEPEVQMPLRAAVQAIHRLKAGSGALLGEADWSPVHEAMQAAIGAMVGKGVPWQQAEAMVRAMLQDQSGVPDAAPGGFVGEGIFSSNPFIREHLYSNGG